MRFRLSSILALTGALALGACTDDDLTAPQNDAADPRIAEGAAASALAQGAGQGQGAVFTSTNAPGGNELLVFARAADGSLEHRASLATGGDGTGGGLGNQGAVTLSDDGRWLLVVNAGSDDVSLFDARGVPSLSDRVPSGGDRPISVAVHGSLVYVLNGGGTENVSGFDLRGGRLNPIAGATYGLSAAAVGSAQVGFSPDGRFLVVTEKGTNRILTFPVMRDGTLGASHVEDAAGATPFGFDFSKQGVLVVSEAFGGAPGASVASSYDLARDGDLEPVSPLTATTQTAACWVAISPDGRFAYTTNTGSNSLTLLELSPDGSLSLADPTAAMMAGTGPIDLAFSRGGRFLHVLNGGNESVGTYRVGADGSLTPVAGGAVMGLPDGATGLAAR